MISFSRSISIQFARTFNSWSIREKVIALFVLSWFYALCAQVAIKPPFMIVPVILHPLPLFMAVGLFGWPAVYAYVLYYMQGALGAPFFAQGGSGLLRICGPTGGYLVGMLFAMTFIAALKNKINNSYWSAALVLLGANFIMYSCGLLQLSFFVPASQLCTMGLYPFVGGCTLKMIFSLPFIVVKEERT